MDKKRKEQLKNKVVNGDLVIEYNTKEELKYIHNLKTVEIGKKDDTGKLRFDLIPVKPLFEFVKLWTTGAKKYTARNWEKGLVWGRVFAAMMRHAWKWWGGEKYDKEDGQNHLASVAWCAFVLMEYEETHLELDDRPTRAKCLVGAGKEAWADERYYGRHKAETHIDEIVD